MGGNNVVDGEDVDKGLGLVVDDKGSDVVGVDRGWDPVVMGKDGDEGVVVGNALHGLNEHEALVVFVIVG